MEQAERVEQDEQATTGTPWHVWGVGILATLWNAFGANDYTQTQMGNRDYFAMTGFDAQTTDAALRFFGEMPAWADAAWALGVWGGLAGSILLLLRSRWAIAAFAASILGLAGSWIFQLQATLPPELAAMNNEAMFAVISAIALLLFWYALRMRRRGVLR
ncbi:MAG: hypothetical protein VX569_04460 [Pseudomonadota bacterium]|nr:hypothetical protein [Pseudomonadota bacterium]